MVLLMDMFPELRGSVSLRCIPASRYTLSADRRRLMPIGSRRRTSPCDYTKSVAPIFA